MEENEGTKDQRAMHTLSGHINYEMKALGTDSFKLHTPTHHLGRLLIRPGLAFPRLKTAATYGLPLPSQHREGPGVPGLFPDPPGTPRDDFQCFPDQIVISDN